MELVRDTVFLVGSLACFADVSAELCDWQFITFLHSSTQIFVNRELHGMSLRLACT